MAHGLTRGNIVSRATELANNSALTTVGNNFLNIILIGLYTNYNWDFLAATATISFASGAVSGALPTDYRTHIDVKWVDTSASPNNETSLSWMPYKDYLRIVSPGATGANPTHYSISPDFSLDSSGNSSGNLLVYPTFNKADSVKLHYRSLPAALSSDDQVPQFYDHEYLVDALTNRLYQYQNDPRWDSSFVENNIHRIRTNLADSGDQSVRTLGLDRRIFKSWGRR